MSTLAIVLIVVFVLVDLFILGGYLAVRRRREQEYDQLRVRIAEADRALEAARAADRGWDRVLLEEAAREALEREKPDFHYHSLHLVLVEDRPGKEEDRAQIAATGDEGELRVVLVRRGDLWQAETLA